MAQVSGTPMGGYLPCGCYQGLYAGFPYPKPCHEHELITREQARKEFGGER